MVHGDYIANKDSYNPSCYDMIFEDDDVPTNIPFINMIEVQKLVNQYTPITKKIFVQSEEVTSSHKDNIIITTNIKTQKNIKKIGG